MKYFLKKLLGHEIFRSLVSWATIFFLEKFVKISAPPPSPPSSYILNVLSLKTKFLHEVEPFKDSILDTTPKNTGNEKHVATLLWDDVTFLKDELRQKEKVIDSLINQSSQQNNYIFQKRNTDNQLEIATANNSNTEDTRERKIEKNSETNISNNKNSEQDISHEVQPINTSNIQENIENNDIKKEKNVTLQNQ